MSTYLATTGKKILLKWNSLYTRMVSLLSKKVLFPVGEFNPEASLRKSLLIARYLVLILISVFYLAGPPYSPLVVKMAVVFSVLLATILAQNLYDNWNISVLAQGYLYKRSKNSERINQHKENTVPLIILIIAETVGSALLILPTGGLDSPFIWYALNPIIAAVLYLPGLYCWGTVALFLSTAIGVTRFYPGFQGSPIHFLSSYMSILLVFFLSTALTQLATSLYKRLGIAYTMLAKAHEATERSLEHISSLYQALEAFSTREDRAELVEVLALYTGKLCEEPAACFIWESMDVNDQDGNGTILRIAGSAPDIDWEKELHRLWNRIKPSEGVISQPIHKNAQLIAAPVMSQGECFGLLAYLQSSAAGKNDEEKRQALMFLAGVAGIILERLKFDKLWARLLVSEEQNRIANEIHDGVAQYLFSMVCALDTISKQEAHLQEEKVQKQLKLVEETASRAARELRASIYKLSPHKRGESIFVDNLASYLDDLGRLNSIQVDLQAEGSEDVLSPALRKGLYRIIREASSNAIRHGKCSSLKVSLLMSPNRTVLEIKDNGCGYPGLNQVLDQGKTGLGSRNMRQLANHFNGDLEIYSEPGKGTLVRCTIPKNGDELREAVNK
ncbi:MAG: sensor histidine kinase [Syntrophomonadaceae bacterium]|jgi:NarL family two-component system sensor histidine kinase LiaS